LSQNGLQRFLDKRGQLWKMERIACALPYVKTHLRHIRQGETHIVSLGVGL
jgi:hypothetical protein